MSLKKYLDETAAQSLASEVGFYTPLATQVFGALLGYPPKHRIINKSGKQGIPDIRLYSKEDASEWIVVEAKLEDRDLREHERRERIWRSQVLEKGYIGPETFYVILCAPKTFYICNVNGKILEGIHIEKDALVHAVNGLRFPLTDSAFQERCAVASYAASMERKQFEAFRRGELKSGYIKLNAESLGQLQGVFSFAIEKLKEYCRVHFRLLRQQYEENRKQVLEIDERLQDLGSGAVRTRDRLLHRRNQLRARFRLAFELFENDYERFKHDQTYAGTQEEQHFEDIFCTNTAYVALSRLFFVRIAEDVGLTTRKVSNFGIGIWRQFVQNIRGHYQDLLEVAFKDVAHVYSSLFEASVFDWFGKEDGNLHDILERILFRLNAFDFSNINRDVLGSIYQYFRPRVERRRLGEYYTPVPVVDYILHRTGLESDPRLMEKRILDPACGSFTFGVRVMLHLLRAGQNLSPENQIDLIRSCLRGQDINPFSAFLSHLSLLFGLLSVYLRAKQSNPQFVISPMNVAVQNSLTAGIPMFQDIGDMGDGRQAESAEQSIEYDYVLGNPPFVRNERLPQHDRDVLTAIFGPLAVRNTDLSVYFLYAAVRHLAKGNGIVGMVAPIGITNTRMAEYLRRTLAEYEILELVSLEWCAKEVFPGADIVPILVFVRKNARSPEHRIRLVRGLKTSEDLAKCVREPMHLAEHSSTIEFEKWANISRLGDWCLDVTERDLPILQKLNSKRSFHDAAIARCSFAIKAGNSQSFLRQSDADRSASEVPFVKGQHVAAFHLSQAAEEYADLHRINTAEDASIWGDLSFYEANGGQNDESGLGRTDYRTPGKLDVGAPSDTLCVLVPEIYVTLVASVIDPLKAAANNSVLVVVPKRYSAHVIAAILNSRISRYYSFLTLRSAILLRRRTTWFPRALYALPAPDLSPRQARSLHELSKAASESSDAIKATQLEVYVREIRDIAHFRKAGFLGVQVQGSPVFDRDDLSAIRSSESEIRTSTGCIQAPDRETATVLRLALLASELDEFTVHDIENAMLPAEAAVREKIGRLVRDFDEEVKHIQSGVLGILEKIDDIMADALGLTATEHAIIRTRSQEFPLSVTVERPRFPWSEDRKSQARRVYRAGERFQ